MGNGEHLHKTFWRPLHRATVNYHLIEVLVFLFLIVPSMVLSLVGQRLGQMDFTSVAIATMVRDLALVNLVFYLIWRNGESLQSLGWVWKNHERDLMLGVILFLPFIFGANYLESFLRSIGLSAPPAGAVPAFLSVHGPGEIVLGLILVIVVALAEETMFRGYLLLRFQGAGLGPWGAAVLASVIFALGHGYEGEAGIVTVGFMGLTFALIYLWRGSLVAPCVMHFLQDFSGIILPALLK
ncbi:MAG: CPBP family intramembrane glutamic endopeptidase [Desulfobaccales bacterium]